MSRYYYATTPDNHLLRVRSLSIRERICDFHDATPIGGHEARALVATSNWQTRISDKTDDPYDVISFTRDKSRRRRISPTAGHHAIAYRFWSRSTPYFYVESVKGAVGDWGYTTDSTKAIPLTEAQQRRFASDCRAAGVTAYFIPTETP